LVLSLCPLSTNLHGRETQAAANTALKPITQKSVHPSSALSRPLPPVRAALISSRINPSDSNGREHGGDRENAVVENLTP